MMEKIPVKNIKRFISLIYFYAFTIETEKQKPRLSSPVTFFASWIRNFEIYFGPVFI